MNNTQKNKKKTPKTNQTKSNFSMDYNNNLCEVLCTTQTNCRMFTLYNLLKRVNPLISSGSC